MFFKILVEVRDLVKRLFVIDIWFKFDVVEFDVDVIKYRMVMNNFF